MLLFDNKKSVETIAVYERARQIPPAVTLGHCIGRDFHFSMTVEDGHLEVALSQEKRQINLMMIEDGPLFLPSEAVAKSKEEFAEAAHETRRGTRVRQDPHE